MGIKAVIEKDIQENQYLLEQFQDTYIRERTSYCLRWHTEKAVKNKYYFYILTSLTIICPVVSGILLSVASQDDVWKVLSGIFMGMSTASAALLTMLDPRRKWGIYRNLAEVIKSSLAKYRFYATEEEFLLELEKNVSATHEKWIQSFNSEGKGNGEKEEKNVSNYK